ncbi:MULTISPECIES: hypothetical protein [Pontibacillus]|uniref:Uncharacterized protein n=1 Tax=Pontibacillus chungwhensis TaxID=265426 RepID=A0ABY8UZS0_9BACI|nr:MULTISPECIES: hypothetical protein [Pontibacillus]MCD5325723.1 hypothetical protein [Pontibacillus sp. HN14]WIF98039.1 hypothetical protein QNI29_20310 [Pontibacillus chungwhensis]
MGWFQSKKNKELEKKILELELEIRRLKSNEYVPEKVTKEYHFHIEHIDIHNPKLDDLSFRLDSLDIEELSGSLNMGNNFSNSPEQKQKRDKNSEKKTISSTRNGYAITFPHKED